ncbi:MAG: AarF/ABC1/UbiB kinase family protein [Myxococcales bacterium]|nr:AarF/ABC1/UbiB kinase family protein [Myxococcales bacterium]
MNPLRYANIGQAWQDVGRLRQIITVLVRHGFGELVARMNLQENIVGRILVGETKPEQGMSTPERLCMVIQELGPTFIKLGQILSTRADLIPEEYIWEFKKLQASAAPLPFDVIKAQVEESLGKPIDELFLRFEEQPLASASIAQVHIAYLLDDTEVVVKVARPGARESMTSDLSIMKFLAKQATQLFADIELFDPVGMIEEFEKEILKEIDFTHELRNINRFHQNFDDTDTVHIPKPYPEMSNKNILVMERIKGTKITEALGDRAQIVKNTLRVVCEMIFVHGFFHGDLHPGNILIEEDLSVALIDFGLVGRLTPRMKDYIIDLLLAVIRRDYEGVAEVLYEIGRKRAPIDYDRFVSDVMLVMDKHLVGARMSDIEFGGLLQDILEGAMRHKMAVPPDYTMMFKALITVEGVGKEMDPNMDLIAAIEPYVRAVVKERYSFEAITSQLFRQSTQLLRLLKQFPVTAQQILMGVENGRIKFGIDNVQFESFLREYRKQNGRKMMVALSFIFLFIATLNADYGSPAIFGLSWFSFLGYVLGGVLGFLVLWGLWSEGES